MTRKEEEACIISHTWKVQAEVDLRVVTCWSLHRNVSLTPVFRQANSFIFSPWINFPQELMDFKICQVGTYKTWFDAINGSDLRLWVVVALRMTHTHVLLWHFTTEDSKDISIATFWGRSGNGHLQLIPIWAQMLGSSNRNLNKLLHFYFSVVRGVGVKVFRIMWFFNFQSQRMVNTVKKQQ